MYDMMNIYVQKLALCNIQSLPIVCPTHHITTREAYTQITQYRHIFYESYDLWRCVKLFLFVLADILGRRGSFLTPSWEWREEFLQKHRHSTYRNRKNLLGTLADYMAGWIALVSLAKLNGRRSFDGLQLRNSLPPARFMRIVLAVYFRISSSSDCYTVRLKWCFLLLCVFLTCVMFYRFYIQCQMRNPCRCYLYREILLSCLTFSKSEIFIIIFLIGCDIWIFTQAWYIHLIIRRGSCKGLENGFFLACLTIIKWSNDSFGICDVEVINILFICCCRKKIFQTYFRSLPLSLFECVWAIQTF